MAGVTPVGHAPKHVFSLWSKGFKGVNINNKNMCWKSSYMFMLLHFFCWICHQKHLTQNHPIQARGTYSLKKHVLFGAKSKIPKLFPKPSSNLAYQREVGDPEQSCNHLCANSSVLCQCRNSTSDVEIWFRWVFEDGIFLNYHRTRQFERLGLPETNSLCIFMFSPSYIRRCVAPLSKFGDHPNLPLQ